MLTAALFTCIFVQLLYYWSFVYINERPYLVLSLNLNQICPVNRQFTLASVNRRFTSVDHENF